MFEVLIETSNRDTRQVRCLNDNCGIGKSEGNLVMLQAWNIAAEHAAFRVRKDAVFIEVLATRATVMVNGEKDSHGPPHRNDVVASAPID